MLQLKDYQSKALESLRQYLRACDELKSADEAFYRATRLLWGEGIPYKSIKDPSELAELPYVCLRLPTGGGKTLLAAHSISVANQEYLKQDNSLVLWLVPSNTILEQTISALKNPGHPYRQALETTLGGVEVIGLTEALYLQAPVLRGSTVIVVSTIQAFRVEDTEGRKVYESAGALQHHFEKVPEEIAGRLDREENGALIYSLANVMRIHRPLVIVDEAHNARTDLSFDTLARLRPSAIIEFTATPDNTVNPSNVLHSVSAMELKAEDMIKLPIRLETRTEWQALLSDAIARRGELEEQAREEYRQTGDYIRPIMLIQAQPRRRGRETLTVEVIEKSLLEDHHIPAGQIARATGEDRELENLDLSDPKCPVRYVITIQALREGWDCPFAYVLCSVAEQRSRGAVEQLLGRVLRLPYCRPKRIKELDRAYAFVTSRDFAEAAQGIVDALVENGFNPQEAREFVKEVPAEQKEIRIEWARRTLLPRTLSLPEVPDPKALPGELLKKIEIDPAAKTVTIKEYIPPEEEKIFEQALIMEAAREQWAGEVGKFNLGIVEIFKSPSERGESFRVPALCVQSGRQLELFQEDHLISDGWELDPADAVLTHGEWERLNFEEAQFGEVDIGEEGRLRSRFIPELNRELELIEISDYCTDTELIHWLDRNLLFRELASEQKVVFLTALVGYILERRQMPPGRLVRKKFQLRKITEAKIRDLRQQARSAVHQKLLFGEGAARVVVTPERCFSFSPDRYPAREICPASDSFTKHYYPKVGELRDEGEEFLCALFLDQLEEVEFWVRNLERQENFSFWLQTATDKFYPDFVCKLNDGRYLVVEYKGADRWSNDDSKEKRRLGELWAMKSDGRCLFIMPQGKDWDAIRRALRDGNIGESG